MHNIHTLLPVCALLLSLMACGSSGAPVPVLPTMIFASQEATAAVPPPATVQGSEPGATLMSTAPAQGTPTFTVSVITDMTSGQVTREQAQAIINEASTFLLEFSPFNLVMVDFTQDGNGGSMSDIVSRYMATRSAFPPNGVVVFSAGDNGQARATGGYGFSMPLGGSFKNAFASPAGANQLYVAVVDAGYKYMVCGYGGAAQPQGTTSLPGECGGNAGVACVPANGYSMCSSAVGNLYTSTPTHAVSSMVVHGLLHNFGPGGDKDDYHTPECSAHMGYPPGYFDLQESEYYNGLCPYVYEEFTKSYQP